MGEPEGEGKEVGEGKEGEEQKEEGGKDGTTVYTSSSPMSSMLPLTIGMSISSI